MERHRLSDRRQSTPVSQYSRIECIQWGYGRNHGDYLGKDSEDKVDELVIQFDANEVTYKRNEWNKITLSYCCSIHKSQGSEFKMVILPMVHQYQRMLQRNLLYTAVTRSKELLILLGEEHAYATCVANESASRMTYVEIKNHR